MRRLLTNFVLFLAIAIALMSSATQLKGSSTNIVISQVYGGGGNAGSTYKNDFIELFNRGGSDLNVTGWSVQYASAAGTTWSVTNLSGTIQAGHYYLVQEAAGAGGTTSLPAPDATGGIAMSATNAKVALVSSTTALSGACPASATFVDLVGFGTGASQPSCFETAPAPTLTNTTADSRVGGGCTDSDNNGADFASGAPNPRNSSSPINSCGGPTNPSGIGSATPNSVTAGNSTLLRVIVTPGTSPASTGLAVTTDLSTIGGSATQQFFDDGTHGDAAGGDNIFSFQATVSGGTSPGAKSLPATITDSQSRTGSTSIALTVTAVSTPPTGAGAASPNSLQAAQDTLLTVTVTPGTNPASTGLLVVGDLSAIGGAASQPFYDDGTHGDLVAFNNVFSFQATISAGTAAGAKSLPIAISDAQSRSGATAIGLTVQLPPPPGAGKVMINEIDADTPGSDTAEFIELYDGGIGNTPLDGLVVVLFDGTSNGSGNQSYAAFDLTGYATDLHGYFVLGNPSVASASIVFDPGPFGLLQNGPDAVALYIGHASDFPNGTVLTTTNLLDAIVYGTDDFSASGLLPLINPGQKIVNEDATGNGQTQSSQRCPNGMGGFRNTSPYYPGTPTPGAANNCPAARPPSDVVISQIYGGGGNSGAVFQNDFVELYNRGAALVDLTGWSLQYSSATGSSWDLNRQPLGGSIGPGEYYLIALAAGSGGPNGSPAGVPLPVAPNISSQINIAAGSGNVALVSSYAGLVGACPIFDPSLKDLVGYGSADCGEGSTTASALNNTTALFRKNNGSLDTDNNANDFGAPTVPNPRRTAPVVELGPAVLTTDPATNGTSAPRDATILVTFTEAVTVDNGWFSLTCASSGAHSSATFAANRGGQDQYITPNDNFTAGEQCTVTIFKDRVHDVDLDDSAPNTDTLATDYSWSFTVAIGTAPPEPPEVHLTMGNPTAASGGDPNNYLMMKPEYALSYNRDLGRPNWVSWHLTDEWIGTLTRVDTFRPDPQVPPAWYRVQSFDFSGSGFDRGHMTPNADRDKETSIPINQATFLMSNMVAQAPANNQGPWAALEAALRDLVTAGNELYIVSGPAGAGGTGSNLLNGQPFVTTTLADGHVTVPASTWKVALVLPKADGDDLSRVSCSTRTIAVIMPNSQAINPDWTTYLTTVDAVEALTGYNFFSSLPEPIQTCIEAGVNGNNPPLVKGSQTITFLAPADRTFGDPAFVVSATGGASGNPVTFSASGVCTASGSNGATITTTAAGVCTITASQAGSALYNAAADVMRAFNVGRAPQAITFDALSNKIYGDAAFTVTASGGASGNPVTFAASGACTSAGPNGATIQPATAGTCSVTASQAGSANYAAAPDVVRTFNIGAATLTVSAADASREFGTPNPVFTGTLTGVVPGDGITASYASTAGLASLPGSYPIVPSLNDPLGRLTNYNVTSHDGVLTIVDTTAPVILSVTPSVTSIWPPSKRMAPVSIVVSAADAVDPSPSCHVTSVSSNEGSSADWQITGPLTVNLLGDRDGNGSGRIYTITVQCADRFGNASSSSTAVVVPHDQRK